MKDIVKRNVECNNPQDNINLIIYYKNKRVNNLIMRNNKTKKQDVLQQCNVVYEFSCPHEDCKLRNMNYIGMTTTTLSRRLTMHLQTGSIKDHSKQQHKSEITRDQITSNTKILKYCNDKSRLPIAEALLIREKQPAINNQTTGMDRVLTLFIQSKSTLPQQRTPKTPSNANINHVDRIPSPQPHNPETANTGTDTHTDTHNDTNRSIYNLRSQSLSNL